MFLFFIDLYYNFFLDFMRCSWYFYFFKIAFSYAHQYHSPMSNHVYGFLISLLLITNQAITNNAVAASKLLRPQCSIIDSVCIQARKKQRISLPRSSQRGFTSLSRNQNIRHRLTPD